MIGKFKKKVRGMITPAPADFEVERDEWAGLPVVVARGEIDYRTVRDLRPVVEQILNEGHAVLLLDMDGVTFMDSRGMGLLFDIVRTVRDKGWVGVVQPGVNIRRMLEITGLDTQDGFRMFADLEEARDATPFDDRE